MGEKRTKITYVSLVVGNKCLPTVGFHTHFKNKYAKTKIFFIWILLFNTLIKWYAKGINTQIPISYSLFL